MGAHYSISNLANGCLYPVCRRQAASEAPRGAVIERSAALRLLLMNVSDAREGWRNPPSTSFTVFSISSMPRLAQQRNCNQRAGAPPKAAARRCRWPSGCF